jgi:uncharacterized protein (DUF433 family)
VVIADRKRGAYEAGRASALAGVPESTLYLWARTKLIVPSISDEKVKIWSWADLVAARAVYWLRHPTSDRTRKPTTMSQVRDLLSKLSEFSLHLGESISDASISLSADRAGVPHLELSGRLVEGRHRYVQLVEPALVVDLLAPFSGQAGTTGPDLRRPLPNLEIVPGRLSGEPHISGTRIETRVLYALRQRGYDAAQLAKLYPGTSLPGIQDAIALEALLANNAKKLAA